MIIKNWKKFLRLVFLAIGVIVFINLIIPDKSFSHQEIEYKEISVINGETLWAIAKNEQKINDYYSGKDVREIVQDIKYINNLSSSELKLNQTLKIPIY